MAPVAVGEVTVRAFYLGAGDDDPHWLGVAEAMQERHGWEAVLWSSSERVGSRHHRDVTARFPDVAYVWLYESNRAIWQEPIASLEPAALDGPLMERLSPAQATAMRMMDRLDYDRQSFTYDERLRLYFETVGRWLAVLQELRPDVLVFPMAPHVVGDYVLYELAQLLGVPTIVYERIWSPTRVIPMTRYEDGFPGIDERYAELLAEGRPARLSEEAEAHHRGMTVPAADYGATVRHYFGGLPADLGTLRAQVKRLLVGIRAAQPLSLHKPEPTKWVKVRGRRIQVAPTRARVRWLIWKGDLAKRRLAAQYAAVHAEPDLSKPYVYVPIHFQPEMTTAPLGGVFVEQEQEIRLLAQHLPAGWQVVVREHPGTYMPGNHGHIGRSQEMYEALAAIPGVVLAPVEADNVQLLARASAVATVTGTSGWEALLRGVPVLVFGYAWFRGCEGAHDVRTGADVEAALAKVAAAPGVDAEKVRLFMEAQESLSYPAYTNSLFRTRVPDRTRTENTEAIVASLADVAARIDIAGGAHRATP